MSIKLIKGSEATDGTVAKAMTMLKNINATDKIEIVTEISCTDIPKDGVLILWPDDTEAIVVPEKSEVKDGLR